MHLFWDVILRQIFESVRPRCVVEIGAERGQHTEKILAYCAERGATLHSIDPEPLFPVDEWKKLYGTTFQFHRGRSLDVLPSLPSPDAVLIDGDHNWFTVYNELCLLAEKAGTAETCPLVALHNIGWPYGRRDLYYAPEDIPPEYRHASMKGGVPRGGETGEETDCNANLWHATVTGGPRNGVLTAIEDFLTLKHGIVSAHIIPGLYGLCILVPEHLQKTVLPLLEHLSSDMVRNYLRVLEDERLKTQFVSDRQMHLIRNLENSIQQMEDYVRHLNVSQLHGLSREQTYKELWQRERHALEHILQSKSWRCTRFIRECEAILRGRRGNVIKESPPTLFFQSPSLAESQERVLPPLLPRKGRVRRSSTQQRNVTIVIPVYRDWSALRECLGSCRKYVDNRHTILIVNDCSPEPDMEDNILRAIVEMPNARYTRNDRNLGFVQTCNRAVFELDTTDNDILLLNSDTVVTEGFLEELIACLFLSEKNAVACPRSNNGSLATIPLQGAPLGISDPSVSFRCWNRLKDTLQRTTVVPTAVGFCMLVRRSIIDNFGLFDEAYGRGYNEENDFACRINRCGYSTILCNRAFIFHHGRRSFAEKEGKELDMASKPLLSSRYPEFQRTVEEHFQWYVSGQECFADILGQCYVRPRVLIDLTRLFLKRDGTSEYALAVMKHMLPLLRTHCDVTVWAQPETAAYFDLKSICSDTRIVTEHFGDHVDLVFVPHQLFDLQQLFLLNRIATRIVCTMQDLISIRCHYLKCPDILISYRNALAHCDGIITVSDAVKKDILDFFHIHADATRPLWKRIHHGLEDTKITESPSMPPLPEGYILLVGNDFDHKNLRMALDGIPTGHPVVVLGGKKPKNAPRANTIWMESGQLDHSIVDELYRRCAAILFPSHYEGFGLPTFHALRHGRPIIALDTDVNREILHVFSLQNLVFLFASFEMIGTTIEAALGAEHPLPKRARTWQDAAGETAQFLLEILRRPVDLAALDHRFEVLTSLERMRQSSALTLKTSQNRLAILPWQRTRASLAAEYLRGRGIEIGALQKPLAISPGATVTYIDRLPVSGLRKHYPDLVAHPLVEADILDDAETLMSIADASQDFVIANHLLEHCEDPIGTFFTFLRVLREGGCLFLAIPDKRLTFDRTRPITTLEHLVRDHAEGATWSRKTHFEEWVRHVEGIVDPAKVATRTAELMTMRYSIHFHVWDQRSIFAFFHYMGALLSFDIETSIRVDNECIFIIRKNAEIKGASAKIP